ncbi:MAG: OsmC family protein, partial [Bacteroidia bacterium]|nr:OsmC family protein [Bacteroidia bacterium]
GKWSPEHFFTAAVSSCFMTTFLAVAENSKLEFVSLEVKAKGKLEMVEGKYMMSEVELKPELVITKQDDQERAERILNKSEAACLISNSIKSKIVFKPEIKVAQTV